MRAVAGIRQGRQGLLFWRKEAKTFGPAVAMVLQHARKGRKVFWFVFQKELLALLVTGWDVKPVAEFSAALD